MAPKNKRAAKAQQADKADDQRKHDGPQAAGTDYGQAQKDEVEALQAIYMDDFEEIETKGAWKTLDRAFKLVVRSFSDSETSATISVKFTATYPKSIPVLNLVSTTNVRPKSKDRIERLLLAKPKELLGEVMMYEIATAIQDVLEDEAQNKLQDAALPTLEEERARQEAEEIQLASTREQEALKRKDEEKAEEDRMLKQMVEEEMSRRTNARKSQRVVVPNVAKISQQAVVGGQILFDHPVTVQAAGSAVTFQLVTKQNLLRSGPVTSVFAAVPVLDVEVDADTDLVQCAVFALKRARISAPDSTACKQKILALEDELERLRLVQSPSSIAALLDFKIEALEASSWEVWILTDMGNQGSLRDLLDTFPAVPVERTRAWTVELLEALDFYHRNGVIHGRIHANNVLLCRPSNGPIFTKLADAGFQKYLHELKALSMANTQNLSARSAYWTAPETSQNGSKSTRKSDVWDLGIVFLEMLFGVDLCRKYSSSNQLMDANDLSDPLEDIIRRFFKADPKKRSTAFDLIPSEFLRNDVPVFAQATTTTHSRLSSSAVLSLQGRHRDRRGSNNPGGASRYAGEWVEIGRLGKGGYGEVVKARNKVDGRIYAIKKIKQKSGPALSEVLSEVMLLSRLNHPYVVRYYTAWPEDDFSEVVSSSEDTTTMGTTEDDGTQENGNSDLEGPAFSVELGRSNTGLDFISSSGYPKIEFGADSDDEEAIDTESEDSDTNSDSLFERTKETPTASNGPPLRLRRTTSSSKPKPIRSTLYIQMEFCERLTLRDLIRKGLDENPDEGWRLFRQTLEGLAHIHGHGIIHRDLKPDNIFVDVTNNPRIGDFGLATSGQYHLADKAAYGSNIDGDMTRSIGTTLYVAPELRSTTSGTYNEKVDMYSLGIIFFEMCYPLTTAMERDRVIRSIREKDHVLPDDFQTTEKAPQGSIILSLISHKPSERPSSAELLRSGKIPLQIEDETIRQALKGLSDPTSPYYHKMMAALFSQAETQEVKDFAWDAAITKVAPATDASHLLLADIVKARLASIFRHHGAIETSRPSLFPQSAHYSANSGAVRLLDSTGTLLQLPYDLTLPHARTIARRQPSADKSFAFGVVYRDNPAGGAPRSNSEADFDIVSHDTLDFALKEAETMKVLDEVIDEFPCFAGTKMCFHINHSDLLELVMDFCRIAVPQRPLVKESLSKLNIHDWTWHKVRNELRSPALAIPSTSLDDMMHFDFRDTPDKAFMKIRDILQSSPLLDRTTAVFNHMRAVTQYLKHMNVHRKIYISPLSSFNEKFYSGGLLFQCLFDTKKRDVLAAGGRYDRLIEEYRPRVQGEFTGCHAVGFNLGWDRIVFAMARYNRGQGKSTTFLKKAAQHPTEEEQSSYWAPRRSDILVGSLDSSALRSTCVRLVADLWAHDLSAELAVDTTSLEELLAHYRGSKHSFLVMLKTDNSTQTAVKAELRVRNLHTRQETDVRNENLVAHLRAELRERDISASSSLAGSSDHHRTRHASLQRQQSGHGASDTGNSSASANFAPKNDVQVLLAQHKGKKTNKWSVVEAAQSRASSLLQTYRTAPIAAVETRDDLLEKVRLTRLSDPESWRKVVQAVPLGDRQYLSQVHELLEQYRREWAEGVPLSGDPAAGEGEGLERPRVAFLYNFRTGAVVLYDLGL